MRLLGDELVELGFTLLASDRMLDLMDIAPTPSPDITTTRAAPTPGDTPVGALVCRMD
jgi:hypothetical protein